MTGLEADDHSVADDLADPRGDPFLRTRFAVPARPATYLRRERLTRHLDQALDTPLTMVNGSAGAGKTLLVADWVADRVRLPVAWLTTDVTGEGPGMFWAYLLRALRTAGVPLSADVGVPVDANRVDPALLTRLAAELSARELPVVVVLDEFDRVTAPEIAEQLEFVLHHAGAGLRLVLVTRTEPLLPLHRYRAAGALTEIRGAELAFTPHEAARLLELHGLRLPPAAVRALVERTRGWAAGLRLAALAAGESPDPEMYLKEFEADRSTIADFLLAEVLRQQDARTRELLLRVSVLDRFKAGLANAVTGCDDAGAVLARLSRGNAFVEQLGHDAYRLHPLFAEILRAHLRLRRPGLEPELHRRAAAWLRRPSAEERPGIRPRPGAAAPRGRVGGRSPAPGTRGPSPSRPVPPPPLVEELSGRELDVLRRLALTMSTEEIAADLYVSVNTVKTHLKSVYRKLSVSRRNEAVRRARELDLL